MVKSDMRALGVVKSACQTSNAERVRSFCPDARPRTSAAVTRARPAPAPARPAQVLQRVQRCAHVVLGALGQRQERRAVRAEALARADEAQARADAVRLRRYVKYPVSLYPERNVPPGAERSAPRPLPAHMKRRRAQMRCACAFPSNTFEVCTLRTL